jgi:hypothetical protein
MAYDDTIARIAVKYDGVRAGFKLKLFFGREDDRTYGEYKQSRQRNIDQMREHVQSL